MLVESFRPGVLEAMGLDPASLLDANPRLVVVRISGWGQDGPYRHKPGFGTLVEGYSGFAAQNGFADREPVLPPMYMADGYAGLYGAAAAMIALRHAEAGGGGQVIDVSLFDPIFTMMEPQMANWRLTGRVKPRTGSRSTNSVPRNAYRTADGAWVCLSASTQGMTEKLLRAIERPELIDDPRFRTNADRLLHVEELDLIIGGFIGARSLDENLSHFDRAGVTIGPVMDAARLDDDRYLAEREALVEVPDAGDARRLAAHARRRAADVGDAGRAGAAGARGSASTTGRCSNRCSARRNSRGCAKRRWCATGRRRPRVGSGGTRNAVTALRSSAGPERRRREEGRGTMRLEGERESAERRGPARRRRRLRRSRPADRRRGRRHRHGGAGGARLAHGRGPAGDPGRRWSGRAARAGGALCAAALGGRLGRGAALREPRARLDGGCLDGDLPRERPALRSAAAGAVQRRGPLGLRHRRRCGRPVLLPGRPADLHRPRLLPGHGAEARRARRLRPGLCDRP